MSKTSDLMALADAWAMSAYADGKKNDGTLASHKSCVCVAVLRAAIEQALADADGRGFTRGVKASRTAAQPQPESVRELTVVEIMRLWADAKDSIVDFARAVLAAQAAKGKP